MFQHLGSEPKYICISTDIKPTTAAEAKALGIEAGAVCTEIDTGQQFRFDGEDWQPVLSLASLSPATLEEIKTALRDITRSAVQTGIATDGNLTTLTDDTKTWPVNAFVKLVVEIFAGTGEGQIYRIVSNTVDTLTVDPAFAVAPDDTSRYRIAFFGKLASDVTHIGGTAQTARDWSLDLANLNITLSALRDSITAPGASAKNLNDIHAKIEETRALLFGTLSMRVAGSTIVVDGTTYQVSGGDTLRGTAAIRPGAALAHAAIPYCFYFSVDTGVVQVTDGAIWVVI